MKSAQVIPGVKIGTPDVVVKEPMHLTIGEEGLKGEFPMKLPPLLEARRKEFAIPDCCFTRVAMFDRCLLWQITEGTERFPGSRLFRPISNQDKALREAPRGIVVTAGLKALDFLWAHGAELGSIVNFVRLSPWRMPVGHVKGAEIQLHTVRVGDIVAIEDLASAPDAFEIVLDEANALHQLKINGRIRPRADLGAEDTDDSY